ncbi:MAG TPA: non-homologous end-joining DNA ligase [Candidatus Acidoferrales bacterium]|nr:non-homologous end-joining DNA ligase [Candidatus Acidoferrales bacterium]
MSHRIPFRVQPMLATLVPKPFHKPGWVYEEKYDGVRLLAYKEGARVQLLSRNSKDHTARFPKIAAAIAKLRPAALLLDGEVVVFDRSRVSRFQLLQQSKGEPAFAVFDCLYCDGKDLRNRALAERRQILEQVVPSKGVLLLSRKLAENGLEAYNMAKRRGYEGLVAKDLSSHYVEKRSKSWLKVKAHQEDEFVIAGFSAPEGSRKYFGALLLGAYERGKLHYVGKVGTGFDQQRLATLHKKFQPLIRRKTALLDPPRERKVTFLAPRLVAQISYQELTADRKLRQPVFLGLRDDKRAKEVSLPEVSA